MQLRFPPSIGRALANSALCHLPGLDNTPYVGRLFLHASPLLSSFIFQEKQIPSSARPDTFTGIGIFQHEGSIPIVTIPFSRGIFLLSLSFRPP